jgi:phasin family protein
MPQCCRLARFEWPCWQIGAELEKRQGICVSQPNWRADSKVLDLPCQACPVLFKLLHCNKTSLKGKTMNFNAEQFAATQKANMTAAAGLSQSVFASFERVIELNMAAGKAAVSESFSNMQAIMGAKTPQDFMAVQAALVQPAIEKSLSYGRHLTDIAKNTGTEFSKAVESKMTESEQAVKSLLESSLKNAPAGSEAAVAVLKTAIEASQNAAETLKKVVKQAADSAETSMKAATAQAEASVKAALSKSKAKA